MMNMDVFQQIYQEYYEFHPDAATLPKNRLYYLHRQWFFPNHIDVMLDLVKDFQRRFYPGADIEVASYAALLHDAGLVYNRVNASPQGHEEQSCIYATSILRKYGFGDEFIDRVTHAIIATEPSLTAKSEEAILVRNADAYSHLSTMHFFAKAHFADNIQDYISWLDKKLHGSFKKLTIQDLIDEKQPLVSEYEKLLTTYTTYKDKTYFTS